MNKKVPKVIRWWVTPKLPIDDVYAPYISKEKKVFKKLMVWFSQWIIHPIKRRLARAYLKVLQRFTNIKVIAITGSCGKTTTKDMLASILSKKGKTVWTPQSIDSVYNIPNTILKTSPGTKYLILEMSVEFPGEMDFYLWLVAPSIGVVTNIYPTHIQFFKSVKGVAEEKVKLVESLPEDGFAVLNKENEYTKKFDEKTGAKVIWFGDKSNIRAENTTLASSLKTKFTLRLNKNEISVQLPVPGTQFVSNASAAAAVGYALGVSVYDIRKGLENYSKPEHRMNVLRLSSGALLLDDSYNNNPVGAREALITFKEIAGNKKTVVVFGDMLELGKKEDKYHLLLGEFISSLGIDYLVGVGVLSKIVVKAATKKMSKANIFCVKSQEEVEPILNPLLKRGTAVLVKGSRSIGLDKLVSRLS